MMNLDLLLQVCQVIGAAIVAVIPPFYPKISWYKSRATEAGDRLGDRRDIKVDPLHPDSPLLISWVDEVEQGFDQLIEAIESHRTWNGDAKRIGFAMVKGEDSTVLKSFMDWPESGDMAAPNAVLYLEYIQEDGERIRDPLVFHPFDPDQTMQHNELVQWIQRRTEQRSHWWTAGLAVSWSALAIASAVI